MRVSTATYLAIALSAIRRIASRVLHRTSPGDTGGGRGRYYIGVHDKENPLVSATVAYIYSLDDAMLAEKSIELRLPPGLVTFLVWPHTSRPPFIWADNQPFTNDFASKISEAVRQVARSNPRVHEV